MLRYHWAPFPTLMVSLLLAGCGEEAPDVVAQAHEALVSAGCTSADTTAGFVTRGFDRQGGQFSVSFEATPTVAPTDALAGLTLGSADGYGDLAAIVRFNPSGFIDARNDGAYQATDTIPYTAGVKRGFYVMVDLIQRRYSAYVDGQLFARDFAFRSEQANAIALDGLAVKVDAGGALAVCNLSIATAQVCDSATPGEGFVNTRLSPRSAAFTVSFSGVPRALNMDGVMGISARAASSFPDLAGALRFGPSGRVEALNGSTYTPLTTAGYVPNQSYSFVLVADAVAHTYSVVGPGREQVTRGLAFRPRQANISSLENFAKVSDSAAGPLTVCDLRGGGAPGTSWIHDGSRYDDGRYSLAVSKNRLLLSDATRTLVLDEAGAVTRQIPYGGTSIADRSGNLYLFGNFGESYDGGTGPVYPTPAGGNVYISKYDSDFNPLYTHVTGTTANTPIRSVTTDDLGELGFVLSDGTAVKLDKRGHVAWTSDQPVTAVALGARGELLVGLNQTTAITLSKLDAVGHSLWSETFASSGVVLNGVLFDGRGGPAFWGTIDGQIQFGGSTFTAHGGENGRQGLLGGLGRDGNPRFIRTTNMQLIKRVLADRAKNLIVVGTRFNPDRWLLDRYDTSGAEAGTRSGDDLLPGALLPLGPSGDAAVDSAGRVYWQFFPRAGLASLNYLAALVPF